MKKLIALLLALVMVIGLVACGKTEPSAEVEDPTVETPDNTQSAEPEELVTLKWVAGANSVPDKEEVDLVLAEANKILNEKIGVNLEIEFMSFAEIGEKMPMYMASNTPWDICWTSNCCNPYADGAAKGRFQKLNDLMDTTATTLKSTVTDY